MELEFQQIPLHYMNCVVSQVQNSEQTQEIKLADGMPDVGHVIGAWGQPVMRGKEWHDDHFGYSGGMMIWVLYAPEDGSQPQVLSSWIPFQMRWDLPDGYRDGQIRICCLPRYVDARSVSPRKIMVRAGMAALGEGYVREMSEVSVPAGERKNMELLVNRYPIRLMKEAGEKAFLLDEELSIPESVPTPEKMIYCTLDTKLQDSRVLTDKLVFRGMGKLHMVYQSETGQLHVWDFEILFSQFAELEGSYGNDGQSNIQLGITSMEPEFMENGRIRLKCGLVAQYLISDREMVETVEDAYSPGMELELNRKVLQLPGILEEKRGSIYAQQEMHGDVNVAVDARFLPDFPIQRNESEGITLNIPGTFQLLYYGSDGNLQGNGFRWEGKEPLPASANANLTAIPMSADTQAATGGSGIQMKAELPVMYQSVGIQDIPMLTHIQMGQEILPDPQRPSLIITRCDTERLWDIAKRNGTTVENIRQANGLEGECIPGQLLLIPIP